MPISHQHRAIFIHIPKTAGTSIETALGIFGDWRVEDTNTLFGQVRSQALVQKDWMSRFLQHLTWTEMRELVPEDVKNSYFLFTCVRNPWDRLVSAFSKKDNDMLQHAAQAGLQLRDLGFREFVEATMDFQHVHLRPQSDFLPGDGDTRKIDLIIRYEQLEAGFGQLLQKIGASIDLEHKNMSTREDYKNYYCDETRRLVARRYAADIDRFGYTF